MSEDRNMSVKAFLTKGDEKQEVRRFGIPEAVSTNFNYVKERIRTVFGLGPKPLTISWQDSDGDQIVISSDDELLEAISDILCKRGENLLRLYVSLEGDGSGPNEPDKVVHVGVVCDECDGPVIGNRYKCTRCKDYDLCEECEKRGVHNRHRKIKLTTAKNPFSAVFGEFMKHAQADEKTKIGFEKDFTEKCELNDEFGECGTGMGSSRKWKGHGRRWSRGGQWSTGNNVDDGGIHCTFQCDTTADEIPNLNRSHSFHQAFHHSAPHHQGPHSQGPHSQGPHPQGPHPQGPHPQGPHPQGPHPQGPNHQGPHQQGPHSPNHPFSQFGAFPGGWPFVSVGVGVPPNMEQLAPEAQRVAEEASKFASQMASKHVADIVKGIWTAWSGNNVDPTQSRKDKESEATPGTSYATHENMTSEPATTNSAHASAQFDSEKSSKDRIIHIDIEMDSAATNDKETSMEQESVKSPPENIVEREATHMETDNNLNEDDTSQASVASGGSLRGEEWTLINQESTTEGAKETPANTQEEVDNDIIEIPFDGNRVYPSIPVVTEPVILTPEEQRIANALDHMKAMGYSDEGGWLTRLLQMKNGDINQVLDLLLVRNKSKN